MTAKHPFRRNQFSNTCPESPSGPVVRFLEETALYEWVEEKLVIQVCGATFGKSPKQEVRQTPESVVCTLLSELIVETVPAWCEMGHVPTHLTSIPVTQVRIVISQRLQPTRVSVIR